MMFCKTTIFIFIALFYSGSAFAQQRWTRVDSLFGDLPSSVQLYRSTDSVDVQPGIAYYLKADLKDRNLNFTTDTSEGRRLTPAQFHQRHPEAIAVMNCTFFSFETNRNLGMVMRDGKLLAYNVHSVYQKKDSQYRYLLQGSFGINKKRKADIAWVYTDSSNQVPQAWQNYILSGKTTGYTPKATLSLIKKATAGASGKPRRWKMDMAVAGGPVLIQDGQVRIYNNEEAKFAGKAIDDRHPRTAIGYTADGYLIMLVVEGRRPGTAEGVTLTQLAGMMQEIGCIEALNLDGGGSSCLLVNGQETIKPSDKDGNQRPVPAVLLIKRSFNP